jgi:hypothetical protein
MNHDAVKITLDGAAIGAAIGAIAGWLPPIAALMSIIWLGMQMYDWIQKKRRSKGSVAS